MKKSEIGYNAGMTPYPTFDHVSEEEYLAREAEAEYKSEYRDGRIVSMSGASFAHNLICTNIQAEIRQQLKTKPCQVLGGDFRTKVGAARLYTYPDVLVVCGEPKFDDRDKNALVNPTILVEVLSKSTETYDRGEKFEYYKKLNSLREYVLVSQNQARIEHFALQGGGWASQELRTLDDTLVLDSIDCRVAVREIYHKIDFAKYSE